MNLSNFMTLANVDLSTFTTEELMNYRNYGESVLAKMITIDPIVMDILVQIDDELDSRE